MSTQSPSQTRWWWIRHAPVPDDGCIYGQRDLDCDCSDVAVFRAVARELPRDAVWFTSSLARTKQTAAAILGGDPRPGNIIATPLAEFAEQHLGQWQGQKRSAFYTARGVGVRTLWFAPADERPPGGESFADLMARVAPAIMRLTEAHRGRDRGGTSSTISYRASPPDPIKRGLGGLGTGRFPRRGRYRSRRRDRLRPPARLSRPH